MTSQMDERWFLFRRPGLASRLRLFCFPYAGGAASIFRNWIGAFPSLVDVCPIQLPGRGSRLKDQAITEIDRLIETLGRAILPSLNLPFAFFGHSMGAIIAFELAHWLREQCGLVPFHLFVSGCRAPHLKDTDAAIHDLPHDEFLDSLRRLNGTPAEVLENSELMKLVLPALRSDMKLCQTYCYRVRSRLHCPITVFGGVSDDISRDDLTAWSEQSSHACNVHMIGGDHFFLHNGESDIHELIFKTLRVFLPSGT